MAFPAASQTMEPADLIVEARWILPIATPVALERQAIVVRHGRIVDIGSAADIAGRYRAREHVVRDTHALLPGLIDAHVEAAAVLFRRARVRGPLLQWLHEVVWPLERRWHSAEFVRVGTQLAAVEMIRAGVTCFATAYAHPEEAARVAKLAHLRAAIGMPLADAASNWVEAASDQLEHATALWDSHRADPLISLFFAPQAWPALSHDTLVHLRRVADQLEAPLAMRLHETQAEIRQCVAEHGMRPLAYLADTGLLRPGFSGVHMNWLEEEDIELAARHGIGAVHCPQMSLRLGSGAAPLVALREAGVLVALGTGHPLTGAIDVLAEARIGTLLAGADHEREAPTAVEVPSALEALRLATLDGARVLGLDAEVGSLEIGKAADFITIDLAGAACRPACDPFDAIVHHATRADVTDSWIAGRAVMRERRVLVIDEAAVVEAASAWSSSSSLGAAA